MNSNKDMLRKEWGSMWHAWRKGQICEATNGYDKSLPVDSAHKMNDVPIANSHLKAHRP